MSVERVPETHRNGSTGTQPSSERRNCEIEQIISSMCVVRSKNPLPLPMVMEAVNRLEGMGIPLSLAKSIPQEAFEEAIHSYVESLYEPQEIVLYEYQEVS
jgi:hypothetical protein